MLSDLEAHLLEVRRGVLLHRLGELLAVEHHFFRGHLAHDLAHVALQHLGRLFVDVGRRGVEEVGGGEGELFGVFADLDIDHGVHVDVDEVFVGHLLLRLHVHLDELERDLVEPFEEGDPEAGLADENPFLEAADDERLVRRRLAVAHGEEHGH